MWEFDPATPVPPDSDSTACSLAALAPHGDVAELATGPALLRAFWRGPNGPFRTWNARGMWSLPERDDPVVNCNILFALRLLGSPATETETMATRDLIARTVQGVRYYVSHATTAHAPWRAGLDLRKLPPALTAPPARNDLLGVLRWLCASPRPDIGLVKYVMKSQQPDGAWPIFPMGHRGGNAQAVLGKPGCDDRAGDRGAAASCGIKRCVRGLMSENFTSWRPLNLISAKLGLKISEKWHGFKERGGMSGLVISILNWREHYNSRWLR